MALNLLDIHKSYEHASLYQKIGKIYSNKGLIYEVSLPKAPVGALVEFVTEFGQRCEGEVISIKGSTCKIILYEELVGINSETKVYLKDLSTKIKISDDFLGRVVDFQGNPIDGKGEIELSNFENRNIFAEPINPLDRSQIEEPLDVGINAINAFTTIGKGQRLSILAGSGVGKSVLLGMIAQNTKADINVIGLIGERGREVLDFIENSLGIEGLKRSVIVVATSDASAVVREKAAYTVTAIAEYFRDRDKDVLLMMDSVTRFAMANREISLSLGEPPGRKGYTPSVFSKLSKLLERAGRVKSGGSITGIYSVLVESGDFDEPVSDAIRAITDGHIVLSRELASKNYFPAIDVLDSISRVMNKVVSKEHFIVAGYLRDLMSIYKESEDLINVGAYSKGSNIKIDKSIFIYDELVNLLKQFQFQEELISLESIFDKMVELVKRTEEKFKEEVK